MPDYESFLQNTEIVFDPRNIFFKEHVEAFEDYIGIMFYRAELFRRFVSDIFDIEKKDVAYLQNDFEKLFGLLSVAVVNYRNFDLAPDFFECLKHFPEIVVTCDEIDIMHFFGQ